MSPYWQTPLAVILLVWPIGVTAWAKRSTRRKGGDSHEAWIRYCLIQGGLTVIAIAFWWAWWDGGGSSIAAAETSRAGLRLFGSPEVRSALFWLPFFSSAINEYVIYDTDRRIFELRWARMQVWRQSFWATVGRVAPLLLIADGFVQIFTGRLVGMVWVCLAFLVSGLGRAALYGALGYRSRELKSGEIRNRAFSMARRMGVSLRKVNIAPQGKGHLRNAFAGALGTVTVTDSLPQKLNYAELDFTLAHELSHLKLGHMRGYFLAPVFGYGVLVAALFGRVRSGILRPELDFAVIVIPVLVLRYISRRREYAADLEAAKFVADPRVAIRSLAKLCDDIPARSGFLAELFSTHPSLGRRARAIGRAEGLNDAEVSRAMEEAVRRGEKARSGR